MGQAKGKARRAQGVRLKLQPRLANKPIKTIKNYRDKCPSFRFQYKSRPKSFVRVA